MLFIKGLRKSYGGFTVLRGLNMTINHGEVYGFIGKNGCGKTTTMNIICNIIPKDEGEIIIGGGNKVKIGYLPETPALFGYMTGREYLDYIAACAEFDGDIAARTAEVLASVSLTDAADRRIKGYSRGMSQRLGIGAAIYRNPDLLILDEPTSALDPEGRAEVMDIIVRLKQTGTTILLCTHILSDVERVADKIGILVGGVMVAEGTISDIVGSFVRQAGITVQLIHSDEEHIRILRTAPLVTDSVVNSINDSKKSVTLYANSDTPPEALSHSIISTAYENKIALESFSVARPSIEDIYLSLVGAENIGRRAGF